MASMWISFSFSPARSALAKIDLALDQGDAAALYRVLSSAALGLHALHPENSDWYFKQLLREKQEKQKVGERSTSRLLALLGLLLWESPQC